MKMGGWGQTFADRSPVFSARKVWGGLEPRPGLGFRFAFGFGFGFGPTLEKEVESVELVLRPLYFGDKPVADDRSVIFRVLCRFALCVVRCE